MTKHTPGPWMARGAKIWYGLDSRVSPYLVAKVMHPTADHEGPITAEMEATAERIVACVNACEGINPAAVPDLLEALKDVYCLHCGGLYNEPSPEWSSQTRATLEAVRAAIAKAEEE